MTLAWDGINFPALDTPVDADNNGTVDYYFSEKAQSEVPSAYKDVYVQVNGKTGIKAAKNGSVVKLYYEIPSSIRYWADNRILSCISYQTIADYADHGYTITQNPGY